MSRRMPIPTLTAVLASAIVACLAAGCSSAPKDEAPVVVPSDPTTGAELTNPETLNSREEPPAPPVLAKPKKAAKAKPPRRRRVREEPAAEDAPPAEAAEMAAAENEVGIQCVVRLPDDSSDHPELCRDFRVVILEVGGGEVDRFRFDGNGAYRFRAKAGKAYELKPLVGKNWRVEIGPKQRFRAGDEIEARFTQKL